MADGKIKITADTAAAERDIKSLEKAIDRLDAVSATASKALLGITAAAGAMGYAILKTLDSAGELIDTANNLGIAAQSLQAIQHAAALTGVSADQLNMSLYKLNQNIGTALRDGAGGATDGLKALGLTAREVAGMKTDKAFELIASRLNEIENPAKRASLAVEFFGKQGPKMLAMAENIAAAKKEMEALGLALSDIDVAALDMAGDSVDELKGLFDSALKKAIADIAPYIVAIVDHIKTAIEEAGGFEVIWQGIKETIKDVLSIAVIMAATLAVSSIASGAIALRIAIKEAGVAMGVFNYLVRANPLMLAVGAALLLVKVLGFDAVGSMWKMLGLSEDLEKANVKIADKAKKIAEENAKNVEVLDEINKKQQDYLDSLDETLGKAASSLQFEKDKLSIGIELATVNKVIADEREKAAKAGIFESEAATKEYNTRSATLKLTLLQTEELKKQNEVVKRLADQNTSNLSKAINDRVRAQAAMAEAQKGGQGVDINSDVSRGYLQSEVNLQKELLSLTNKGEAERYAVDAKYKLARQDLMVQSMMYQTSLEQQGFNAKLALKNLEIQKELELYNLKVKLSQDEIALQANKYAMMMSQTDAYYLKSIGGEKAIQEAARTKAEFEKKSTFEKTQFGIEAGAQMFSALGAQNKKAFEAAKAFNIANAIMNTYMAATKALASYPFPFSLIASGAAIAMGMAQVAQIRSQSYSGRALGGPVMGNQTYMVGESGPELFTPSTTGSITRNGDLNAGTGATNINFNIQANDAQGFDDLLIQRRGMITQIIRDAMAEQGQRSRM